MNQSLCSRRSALQALGAVSLTSLAGCGALGAMPAQPPATAPARGTQLVLLGTKGGPRIGGPRSNPANLLLIDGVPYVIDCGYGAAQRLTQAGVALPSLRYIFMTHMHSDHNLDLAGLLYGAWSAGQRQPIEVYGPPTVDDMVKAYFEYMKFDFDIRIADEGKPDPRTLAKPHIYERDGLVMQNAQVRVTAARNIHPPIQDSFALRFDTADRSIVFSGDTNYSEAVIALAKNADVLVHEVIYVPGIDALARRVPNAKTMREHLLAAHTSTEDVGRVAAAAGVKKLVLSHFVPGDDPSITDDMWLEGVRKHFNGDVIVGKDLMVI
ncbi:MAG: MBL fold metallo-hydrolase [Rhizobacter sp.]